MSDLARVMRVGGGRGAKPGRILRDAYTNSYRVVHLRDAAGIGRMNYVHRLVARAFLGAPWGGRDHVDHTNSDRSDNHAANLRWVSPAENSRLMVERGRSTAGARHPNAKLKPEQRDLIRELAGTLPQRLIGEQVGVTQSCVSAVLRGKTWSTDDAAPAATS